MSQCRYVVDYEYSLFRLVRRARRQRKPREKRKGRGTSFSRLVRRTKRNRLVVVQLSRYVERVSAVEFLKIKGHNYENFTTVFYLLYLVFYV